MNPTTSYVVPMRADEAPRTPFVPERIITFAINESDNKRVVVTVGKGGIPWVQAYDESIHGAFNLPVAAYKRGGAIA